MNFRAYIEDRSIPEPNSGCWLWLLSLGSHGYPQGSMPRLTGERVSLVHRMSYAAFKGAVPKGMDVDHLCRNTLCVNPDHLEAATQLANRRRQAGFKCDAVNDDTSRCPHGHGDYRRVSGKLVCAECRKKYP